MTKLYPKQLKNRDIRINAYKARNLWKLVKNHKNNCNNDCGISLYLLLEVFENYMGRKATPEELEAFL